MKKKTITWVTPDYFVDCDFNPEIFSGILQEYNIHWIILLPKKQARFSEKDFADLTKLSGLSIQFIYWNCRERSPKMLLFYEQVYKAIKQRNADIAYFNYVPTNPYILPLYQRLKRKKTIVTAHDGNVKGSFKLAALSKHVFNYAFRDVRYVNMFSKTEADRFKRNFRPKKVFVIPLGLKDFGKSELARPTDHITFLFFGSINSNKNVELLIEAACNLYEKGVRGFKVSINGFCNNWNQYASYLTHPEIFDCNIRMFKNADIPDLFARSHYAVFPYKDISQSGALKVAFNYGTPVIVSDLQSFKDEVEEGVNGFVFQSNSVEDLERVMLERISSHRLTYHKIVEKAIEFNQANYNATSLVDKYLDMFNHVAETKMGAN